ncbi:MAG: entericidin A/B family lipoprotein [Alphaproteobacteria bacterium]|nr:entericidin A/B family lipoprotein [Alphaproteobacteria bacterium]
MRGWILAGLAAIALAGCNTVEGFGKDMAKAGDAISGAAAETRSAPPHPVDPRCAASPQNGRTSQTC